MIRNILLLTAAWGGVQLMPVEENYLKQIETWRNQRISRLTSPTGWLSLVGLPWLKEGENTLGSASDNSVILLGAPDHLGVVTLNKGKATIELSTGVDALIDGKKQPSAELLDDSHETPTTISYGTVNFYLVHRGDQWGLRVKDSEAPTRKQFEGIDYFDIDPSWRIEARWQAYDPPHTLEMSTVIGTTEKYPVLGKATFERDGHTYELLPVLENPGDTELFLVFADRTSGKETYGAARFLYMDMPKDGKVIIDFNKAYNPPCAFTAYATCPLAPPENRLDLRVIAGEKKYRAIH